MYRWICNANVFQPCVEGFTLTVDKAQAAPRLVNAKLLSKSLGFYGS